MKAYDYWSIVNVLIVEKHDDKFNDWWLIEWLLILLNKASESQNLGVGVNHNTFTYTFEMFESSKSFLDQQK